MLIGMHSYMKYRYRTYMSKIGMELMGVTKKQLKNAEYTVVVSVLKSQFTAMVWAINLSLSADAISCRQ